MKLNGVHHAMYKDHGFHPHITVAFRDLKKSQFVKAWEEFEHKEFNDTLLTTSFSLLKHNGKIWEVYKKYSFSTKII